MSLPMKPAISATAIVLLLAASANSSAPSATTAAVQPQVASQDGDAADSFIVQAATSAAAQAAVRSVGGRITHELGIIDGVAATLDAKQLAALRQIRGVSTFENGTARIAGYVGDFWAATQVGADRLHAQGITGRGVTVALLDSGLWRHTFTTKDSAAKDVYLMGYDAIGKQDGPHVRTRRERPRHAPHKPRGW